MKDRIKYVLKKVKGNYFNYEENLITDGYLTSFDILTIITALEEEFAITIPMDMVEPLQFNSINRIEQLIVKIK